MAAEVEIQVMGANVGPENPLPVSATINTSGLATSVKQDTGNTSLTAILAALGTPLAVTGNFYQATQPISGSVAVSNFPASQAVTGVFFQATQPVSGSVSVSNFPASFGAVQSGVWTVAVSGSVAVTGTFWQATQPVSLTSVPTHAVTQSGVWSMSISNASLGVTGTFWQATQPVSGTFWQATQPVSIASMPSTPVTGTFWQATQPVSIASLPALVAGSANIGHITVDNASLAVTGTFWQATQPVSGTFWQATQPISGTVTPTPDASANRTLVTLSAVRATGATAEALLTLIANKAGVNQSGATSYTVTAGKTLRLTGLHVDILNTTTVANRVEINVRAVNGTVGTGSPLVGRLMAAAQAALAAGGGSDDISFPEGVCIPAGWQVGISQICSVTTASIVSVVLTGYEY